MQKNKKTQSWVVLLAIAPTIAVSYFAIRFNVPYITVFHHPSIKFNLILNFGFTFVFIPFLISLIAFFALRKNSKIASQEVRGSKIFTHKNAKKTLIRDFASQTKNIFKSPKPRIYLGKEEVPLPRPSESEGVALFGQQGSGKTQAILGMIEQIIKLKETLIIYDVKDAVNGDFFGRYYRMGQDYLLHTGDQRSIKLNVMAELKNEADVDFFVEAAIVDESDSVNSTTSHFVDQSKLVLKAVLFTVMHSFEKPSNVDLIDFLLKNQTAEQLCEAVEKAGFARQYGLSLRSVLTQNDKGSTDNQGQSVWSTFNRYATRLKNRNFYYNDSNFSIKNFVNLSLIHNVDVRLFVVNPTATQAQNQLYFRLFFAFLSREIRSLPTLLTRRIWLFLDEFQTLGRLKEIVVELPAEARSKGACLVLASQNLAKVREIFGENLTNAILSGAKTKLVFTLGDDYSLRKFEDIFGENEQEETHYNISRRVDYRDTNWQETAQKRVIKTVLGSQISTQKNLECWYKTGAIITQIHFNILKIPHKTEQIIAPEPPLFRLDSVSKNDEYLTENVDENSEINDDLVLNF